MTPPAAGTTYERELTQCPDCGEALEYTDGLEYHGTGLATAFVECPSEDCDFRAREDWVIDRTIRLDETDPAESRAETPA